MGSCEIRVERFRSQVLQGNPLADPAERSVHLLLPPGYASASDRYPVTFLLAGFGGSGARFFNYEFWDESLPDIVDRLLDDGNARPMILVMPDATTRFGGSQYLNSPATGRYQDYLLELVDWVDAEFRTIARREARAVAGKSSGGFGALRLAMDHPDVFGLAADHCGDKYFETCYYPSLPRMHRAVAAMPDLAAALADPRSVTPKNQAFFDVMEAAALASCYSPNPDSPYGCDFPFDLATGALLPEVWARWREHDPLVRLDGAAEALRSLRLLFLDCGRNDEFYLNVGMRLFHDRLAALGIEHTYLEHDGGHFNLRHRYAYSLEAISRSID